MVRAAAYLACLVLVGLALCFSLLAVIFTGGDSAFATRSSWVYSPWLVALVLTSAAIVATATGRLTAAAILILAAGSAYAATWIVWEPGSDA